MPNISTDELSFFSRCLVYIMFMQVYIMFMVTNLIEPCMEKLIIRNNCPDFRNKLLNSNLFKLTLGRDCLEPCFCTVAFKSILTQ